jgi:glycine betaine/proline transport system ATP-binding protein
MLGSTTWPVPVVNEAGRYLGVVSKNLFLRTLQRGQQETARPEAPVSAQEELAP